MPSFKYQQYISTGVSQTQCVFSHIVCFASVIYHSMATASHNNRRRRRGKKNPDSTDMSTDDKPPRASSKQQAESEKEESQLLVVKATIAGEYFLQILHGLKRQEFLPLSPFWRARIGLKKKFWLQLFRGCCL